MRCFLLKCLVVLVSLALVSGNAHAALTLDVASHSDPCLGAHEHAHEAGGPASHRHDKAHHDEDGCCCQCLGCTAAMDVLPALTLVPSSIALRVRFEQRTPVLGTRALNPELDPPRPGALI